MHVTFEELTVSLDFSFQIAPGLLDGLSRPLTVLFDNFLFAGLDNADLTAVPWAPQAGSIHGDS